MHVNVLTHGMLVNIGPTTSYVYIILWLCSCILKNIWSCYSNFFFWLSPCLCPYLSVSVFLYISIRFFPEPDPVSTKNIETEMEEEFFRPFPSVFIPTPNSFPFSWIWWKGRFCCVFMHQLLLKADRICFESHMFIFGNWPMFIFGQYELKNKNKEFPWDET